MYELTEEHRLALKPWADKWIANAMNCDPMTDHDKSMMIEAINGLYTAARLDAPEHIIFVPSPLVGQVSAGFAAALWWLHDHARDATWDAIEVATWGATGAATEAATWGATGAATGDATEAATGDATEAATRDATGGATWANSMAKRIAPPYATFLCECANSAGNMRNGGNHWSGYVAFLSFFRHIAKLDLPVYESWRHYENAAIHGSWRFMHPKFCIVSDRPTFIKTDSSNRPHCEDGPSHKWRDGWALYHWHGLRVPDHWINDRENLDPNEVIKNDNVELRAAGAEICGWNKMFKVLDAKVIDEHPCQEIGQLIEMTLPGLERPGRFLRALCPRNGWIVEGVPNISDIDQLPIDTAIAAQAWRIGDPQSEYVVPPQRT